MTNPAPALAVKALHPVRRATEGLAPNNTLWPFTLALSFLLRLVFCFLPVLEGGAQPKTKAAIAVQFHACGHVRSSQPHGVPQQTTHLREEISWKSG